MPAAVPREVEPGDAVTRSKYNELLEYARSLELVNSGSGTLIRHPGGTAMVAEPGRGSAMFPALVTARSGALHSFVRQRWNHAASTWEDSAQPIADAARELNGKADVPVPFRVLMWRDPSSGLYWFQSEACT